LAAGDAAEADATLRWDAVTLEDLRQAGDYRGSRSLLEKLRPEGSFDGSIFLLRGRTRQVLQGTENPLAPAPAMQNTYRAPYIPFDHGFGADSFVAELSARQPEGFFSIVSTISPCGGESFEDLAVLDET